MNNTMWAFTKRNIRVFLRDRLAVFFTFLAPIIIVILYLLFFGKMQYESNQKYFKNVDDSQIRIITDGGLVAGLISLSSITTATGLSVIQVRDRETDLIKEIDVTPARNWTIKMSYMLFNMMFNIMINLGMLTLGFIYLGIRQSINLNWYLVISVIAWVVFISMSGSVFIIFILNFFKSTTSFSAFSAIFSSGVGFVIGAYLPFGLFPDWLSSICTFIPGANGTIVLKNLMLEPTLNSIYDSISNIPNAAKIQALFSDMGLKMLGTRVDLFGMEYSYKYMIIYFSGITIIFGFATLLMTIRKRG